MTVSFLGGDVELADIGVHSTRVDQLAQMRLNSLRSTVETVRDVMPGIGAVLAAQVESLAEAIAAGGKAS